MIKNFIKNLFKKSIEIPSVKVKRTRDASIVPTKAHRWDAGYDLYVVHDCKIPPFGRALIPTGVAFDIPKGYLGMVVGRSGNTSKRGFHVPAGIIDSHYKGEVFIVAFNHTRKTIKLYKGERAAQMLILPMLDCCLIESEDFSKEDRGGGLGSTGL